MAEFDEEWFDIDRILFEEETVFGSFQQQQHTTHQQAQMAHRSKKQLSLNHKRQMVDAILLKIADGNVPRGFKAQLGVTFGVHKSTITRLFQEIAKQIAQGNVIDVRSKKFGKVGRKPFQYSDEWLQSVSLEKRSSTRSYAGALKISHMTVHNLKKKGKLRTHTSTTKPALTENHKVARLRWVLSFLQPATTPTANPTYMSMQNMTHIVEKWFYLNPETRRFYLLPKEEDSYRCQQSKYFRIKAMFMGMIGKPVIDDDGQVIHDGKYGMWPFVIWRQAQRTSKNRDAGTWEVKAQDRVNKEVIRDMLLMNIIPALKSKWPDERDKNIFIQWDNAKPHVIPTDEEFKAATQSDGFNIQFIFQPAQSPDLNVLVLGFFRVIQSLQYQTFPKDLSDLIDKVEDAFNAFDPVLNKYTWITLQSCMTEILKWKGHNKYKIPHMGKKTLDRLGVLPQQLQLDREVVQQAVQHLDSIFRLVCEDEDQSEDLQPEA